MPFDAVKDSLIDCAAKNRIPENAKTVIMFVLPYKVKEEKPQFLSRYAAVPDYHDVAKNYIGSVALMLSVMYPENEFEFFVDNSPVKEVDAAAMAGLGVKGRNGLLITEKYGSYVFLGEIITDLPVLCEAKEIKYCNNCGKCLENCRVGLQKGKCLSDLSQKKGDLTEDELKILREEKILWGCDGCAEVCPLNKNAQITYIKDFLDGYRDMYEPNENPHGRAYTWRGYEPIKRNYVNLYDEIQN